MIDQVRVVCKQVVQQVTRKRADNQAALLAGYVDSSVIIQQPADFTGAVMR